MRRSPRHISRRSSSGAQRLFTAFLVLLFLVIVVVAGLLVRDEVRRSVAASEIWPDLVTQPDEPRQVVYEEGQPLPRWKGTDRLNILVMGIDQREHEEGPWRTDTMLVLTIDPVTLSAGVLSIPRDLWVPIADYGEQARINQAHFLGEVYGYPGGGPALAAKTVQYNLGIHIHHYARVNFTAFEEVVDLIGGIEVCVDEEINDPTYPDEGYGYAPLHIDAGCQTFDGETALKYARTRHSGGGDFDRARRQQKLLRAVFEKVTQPDELPRLAAQSPELWETLQGAVVTDLKLDEIIALANLASEVDPDNIRFGVIDENYVMFWTTPDGQEVLVPQRDRIRELRDRIFTSEPLSLKEDEDPLARLKDEAATIQVLNGTTTPGLAKSTQLYLVGQGMTVGDEGIGNADHISYTYSKVVVHTGKTYTAEYLADLLQLPETAVVHEPNPGAAYDITVILGSDYTLPASSD
ncbi:MAG: LCP family protein [Anaerolineae bacterium]|nr:LCP family protein [Anaerolineae bacterium]